MTRLAYVPLLALALASPAWADPPKAVITGKATYPAGSLVLLDASKSVSEPGLAVKWVITPPTPTVSLRPDGDTRPGVYLLLPAAEPGTYRVKLVVRGKPDAAKPDLDADADVLDLTVGPVDPVKPVDPNKPVDPPPGPVTSFRVILVSESGDPLTAAQRAVLYGADVEAWLTANCTGGKAGWRRRDKDSPGDADPTVAALWTAVQGSLKPTDPPCVAVEVNGKVTILPLDTTPAQMIATLTKYRGK